ncbi:hypothetical protein ACPOL_1700 [Acidisarcina polymorpha]|uniref:Uncharacterized protein n=1 Tax=Acidisarcina polymorpha TaxID=2211140 RepID=A0A2Z5FX02_9BACT|nr:chitobiase/beta-hexosaminidase C-terminal domain-containing protein [Acidisarcina polymorpha]AXC11044.1 hypothetical protein ACPOL_1700 [Acidisarcina polymorpha]
MIVLRPDLLRAGESSSSLNGNLQASNVSFRLWASGLTLGAIMALPGNAQVNVLTAHNDIARTGQNVMETTLTPANVNSSQFGRLFSQTVAGPLQAQPLYVANVAIPNMGTHNVVYAAAATGTVYAFDADSNGGVDANPLWKTSLPGVVHGKSIFHSILGTPVIDLSTSTMYVACVATESGSPVFRLHALDIRTGAEKFGAPVQIQGSLPGTGSGSTGGVLPFDPTVEIQRPALLLLNGVVYIAFGSLSDQGAYHGWIFSYSASSLERLGIYCTSPNGSEGGIWMGGAGLAAEVNDPNKPFGRMFVSIGNGAYSATPPYTNSMSYGMSILDLDLNGGTMTVKDEFTPYNEAKLDSQDGDLGSGGAVLLPAQSLKSGGTLEPLLQIGKVGIIGIFDRNNLGGFSGAGDQAVQEVQTASTGASGWGAGVWGAPAYWNGNIYIGGTKPGGSNSLAAYSFAKGQLSSAATSNSAEEFAYPAPTPSVSSNGSANGIVWALKTDAYVSKGPEILLAFDAENLANLLYSSSTNQSRDNPGAGVTYVAPTVANGKVYVGAASQLSVYGLLSDVQVAAAPVITPSTESFTGSLPVTISESISGAKIYYTTDGSRPTVASKLYQGPITITSTQTITALASANGFLQSPASEATYTESADTNPPQFSLAGGSYSGAQQVIITDSSPGSSIYYTLDGSQPTTASALYRQPITVSVSETVTAIATAPGLAQSPVTSAIYTIGPAYTFNYPQGFAQAGATVQFNGSTGLDDFRLQLTNGGKNETGSAFYATPVNVQSFTTDFVFQLSNPAGDGITFTIQNAGPTALGGAQSGLGYVSIQHSIAIKFDLVNQANEGPNGTGLFIRGNTPRAAEIDMTGSGVDLHSGDAMGVQLTYDGVTLKMTITDQLTGASWQHAFPVDIPAMVGGATAYVGFTGSTGGNTASQKINSWSYIAGSPSGSS